MVLALNCGRWGGGNKRRKLRFSARTAGEPDAIMGLMAGEPRTILGAVLAENGGGGVSDARVEIAVLGRNGCMILKSYIKPSDRTHI